MGYERYRPVDCDGHVIESIEEMKPYMDDVVRYQASRPALHHHDVFPNLDGAHFAIRRDPKFRANRINASNARAGSPEDWSAFLEKTGVESSVLFPSEGLAIGMLTGPDYAARLSRAYNDYVHDRFAKPNPALKPIALIPMQDPELAVKELKHAVKDLGFVGAMLPSVGLPLHLGHPYYDPVYRTAADLGCVLCVHGGSSRGIGFDSFTNYPARHALHHTLPLATALVGMIYHGTMDRFPSLKFGFMEGGCGWLAFLLDRMHRDKSYYDKSDLPAKAPEDYLGGGRILVGCEGSEETLAHVARRVGVEAFAYASDYPHEVDLPHAIHEIEEVAERADMSDADKAMVLRENARRFFAL
jgi:predicted TIM-barrel fold metal-dependent hydrolase